MNPVPSPYNSATGGVRYAGKPLKLESATPLLPLWEVTYSQGGSRFTLYLRAQHTADAVQELRRLHPAFDSCSVQPWPRHAPADTGASECHGHPGAPHPTA